MRDPAIAGARAAVVCGVLAAAVGACGSDSPSPTRPAPTHALAPLPLAGRGGPAGATAVGFRAGDGVGLRGRLFGRGTAAVVLAHMGNAVSNEADWYPLARRLAREGYLVLTYNRRAVCSGEKAHYDCSAGANDWGRAWQNVVGAVRFVASRGARRVAVGGSRIGGTTAVYAAATGRIHPAALISLAGVNHITRTASRVPTCAGSAAPSSSCPDGETLMARRHRRASSTVGRDPRNGWSCWTLHHQPSRYPPRCPSAWKAVARATALAQLAGGDRTLPGVQSGRSERGAPARRQKQGVGRDSTGLGPGQHEGA